MNDLPSAVRRMVVCRKTDLFHSVQPNSMFIAYR
jgi:hypothetical protein